MDLGLVVSGQRPPRRWRLWKRDGVYGFFGVRDTILWRLEFWERAQDLRFRV